MIYIMKNNKQIVIRVSEELRDAFTKRCEEVGYSVSKRLRVLMEAEVEDGTRI